MALHAARVLLGLAFLACSAAPASAPKPAGAAMAAPSAAPAPKLSASRLLPPSQGRRAAPEASEASAERFRAPLVEPERTRAVVLLYHAFDRGPQPLSVRSSHLRRQLLELDEAGVEVVSTSELMEFLDGQRRLPERVAVISIDDGLRSVYERAWPILRERGVRFTLGIPTGMLEEPKNAPVMTWEQVREMVATGLVEIASHGHMHRRLVGLSGRKLHEELVLSQRIIEQRVGVRPTAYFYPLGAWDELSAAEVRRAGYRAAFRATGAPIALGSSGSYWLPRTSVLYRQGASVAYFFSEKYLGQVRADPDRVAVLTR